VRIPAVVSLWDNRLAIASGGAAGPSGEAQLRIRYLRPGTSTPVVTEVRPTLPDLVTLLAATPDRTATGKDALRQGLNLSYSQVVAVLSALQTQGATRAAFSTESDRLGAALAAANEGRGIVARADNPEEAAKLLVRPATTEPSRPATDTGPRIVPIEPPAANK
jgi:hypothetical protein